MKTFTRVGVFVEMAAVEVGLAMGIGGEMRGYPVEDPTDAGPVTGFNEATKAGWVAEA